MILSENRLYILQEALFGIMLVPRAGAVLGIVADAGAEDQQLALGEPHPRGRCEGIAGHGTSIGEGR